MRIGVLVNPIAGFGGTLAMHGTDLLSAERFEEAVRVGRSAHRLLHTLERFRDAGLAAELLAAPGLLGADHLAASGIRHRALESTTSSRRTRREDTVAAARLLAREDVDVLLFAGGDGTATDIAQAIGSSVPVIGVPSGVKMHSEVFPRSPASAGRLLADFVAGHTRSEPAEVVDVGSDDRSTVVGMLMAPRSREALQGAKTSAPAPASGPANRAIAQSLLAGVTDDATWIIGPGNTAGAVAAELGFEPTLRGFDVRYPSGEVERDVTEDRLHLIATEAIHPRLVLGVVGGQGFLLGRGNQQLSHRVVERIGAERIEIVATVAKVGGLHPALLFVDADEAGSPLLGYRRVRTGFGLSTVMRVVDAAA